MRLFSTLCQLYFAVTLFILNKLFLSDKNGYFERPVFVGGNVDLSCIPAAVTPPNITTMILWKYRNKSRPGRPWLLMAIANATGFVRYPPSPFERRVESQSGRRLIISNITLMDSVKIMCEIKNGRGETPRRIFYRLIVTQSPSKLK